MSDSEPREPGASQREETDPFQIRLSYGVEVLQELLNLLEKYAPVWYTEWHQSRTVEALRGLEESRQLAKTRVPKS